MGYQRPTEVVASAARTATGNSGTLAIEEAAVVERLALVVDVTAASGTSPTLDVTVEWSTDGGATFAPADPADAFTQITATAAAAKSFTPKAPHYRVVWTIGGTSPSFTFTVDEYAT